MADNITIKDAAGSNVIVGADELAGAVYVQRIKRLAGPDGSATDFLDKASRSDAFTDADNGTTVDVSEQGMSKFSLQVKGTGAAPTSWTVVLEASLDGATFTTVLTHTDTAQSDGAMLSTGAAAVPALYFRSRCVAVVLGSASDIVATIAGCP